MFVGCAAADTDTGDVVVFDFELKCVLGFEEEAHGGRRGILYAWAPGGVRGCDYVQCGFHGMRALCSTGLRLPGGWWRPRAERRGCL